MPKQWVKKYKRFEALTVFLAGFASILLAADLSWADESIPVPAHKPASEKVESLQPSDKPEVIRYSLLDFTKALLDFGTPPVPKAKPVLANKGPMTDEEAKKYKEIFALQEAGKIKEANQKMADLRDWRLRGYVLHQRYMHPTAYKSNFEELQNWLVLYNDHAGADKIYQLALRKNSGAQSALAKPRSAKGTMRTHEPMMVPAQIYKSKKSRSAAEDKNAKNFESAIVSLVSAGRLDEAVKTLEKEKSTALLDDVEYDLLQAKIAAGYLYKGRTEDAFKLAARSADRSGLHVPVAGWVAGLVSWHDKKYKRGAKYFEITARSPYASGWTSAAGSYWAARSHMRTGNVKAVSVWLRRAMEENPRTFYGLIATRALGRNFDFNWHVPTFTKAYLDILNDTASGSRAVALIAAGQQALAEAELLRINTRGNPEMRDALLAYASYAGMPALAMRIGGSTGEKGAQYDAALYPMGPWKPREGYKIDPALMHAIMRQESRFDPEAESPSGARGLMQLMPTTASYIARSNKYKKQDGMQKLMDPETNLDLGQKYLEDLLGDKNVRNDLLSLLVAYNAGPGNLARWKKNWPHVQDPLLFIELIPSSETRAYVERVLANYWIYRLREGLPTPSLDAVAAGKIAQYAGYDPAESKSYKLAQAQ